MSNEAENSSKFALFPREDVGLEEGNRSNMVGSDSSEISSGRALAESKGRANLVWGVLLTVTALLLSGVGHRLAPVEARVSLVTGGVLVLGLYVMGSIRVLSRQNGFFLGLAFTFLLVALVPVGMSFWQGAADYAARIRLAEVTEPRGAVPHLSAGVLNGEKSGLPSGLPSDALTEKTMGVVATAKTVAPEVSSVSPVSAPAVGAAVSGPAATRSEEKLSVEEREAKIAAMAEISAPVVKRGGPSKALASGGLPGEDISLNQAPAGAVGVSGLSQKEFSEKVLQSKLQVVQRYPALGRNGSDEVKVYTEVFNELVRRNRDFFLNPDWPLELAELVGKREGWIPEEGSLRK